VPSLAIRQVGLDHPDAAYLVDRVQAVYLERYGSTDVDGLDAAEFTPPDGAFHVGYLEGAPVACGAWRRSPHGALGASETAEIKRMYVVEEAQRRGLARAMLAHLEAEVSAAGFAVVVLETGPRQPEALALYEQSGFVPVAPFGHYADRPTARFFAKRVHFTSG
jgi:GNAT superfamily N-acetyltransferase